MKRERRLHLSLQFIFLLDFHLTMLSLRASFAEKKGGKASSRDSIISGKDFLTTRLVKTFKPLLDLFSSVLLRIYK